MVYSIVRGSEYFRVCVALVVRMRKGIKKKKKKVRKVSTRNSVKREEEKKESRDITGIIKRQEHQA